MSKNNSGNSNSGNWNSGNRNSGYWNSGNRNSGDSNSGDWNSGDWNSGDRNSGFFNTNEPCVRIFNKETNLKRSDLKIPFVNLEINTWVHEDQMTDAQKEDDKDFHTKGGTLITRTYKEAWALYWGNASKEDKQLFLDLPNFDADIFKEITGIDVEVNPTCDGKIVEIDGKKYKLSEV